MIKKRKAGRPALQRVKFTTTLPPGYVDLLREIGNGNASGGLVRLVDYWAAEFPATASKYIKVRP